MSSSISVEYNQKEQNEIMITNILKMLERRNLIKSWKLELKEIGEIKPIIELNSIDKTKISINLSNLDIKSIQNGSPLDEYLSKDVSTHKIVLFKNIAKKVVKQLNTDYKNVEFFFNTEMMEDVPSKVFIPEHQLLGDEQKAELLSKISEPELAIIKITDFMARYYRAKSGDVFRIIRPSITCGENIFYRKVVNSSWDILFD